MLATVEALSWSSRYQRCSFYLKASSAPPRDSIYSALFRAFSFLSLLQVFLILSCCEGFSFLNHRQAHSVIQMLSKGPLKVSIIGSGNWGTAVSKIVATNTKKSCLFEDEVKLWVYEELIKGKKLTSIINSEHENTKYLPGTKLPSNLVASSDLQEVTRDANLLVFVLPHQFLKKSCEVIKSAGLHSPSCKAISLIKGIDVDNNGDVKLLSSAIQESLGMDCCVLSGANVAKDVAAEFFSEASIGYKDLDTARVWQQLFDAPYFRVSGVPDVAGVEVSGAVKNVIALAAGFCDGLNLGSNTKAAIIRIGFEELRKFAIYFFDGIVEETFFESAGIADTITTCYGGRNVRCAAEFVRQKGAKSWEAIELELLDGQKLQGTLTCADVYKVVQSRKLESMFPLFTITYRIAFEGEDPYGLIKIFMDQPVRKIKTRDECNPCIVPSELKAACQASSSRL